MSEIVREYHLRPIEERDLRLLLDWRNSSKVHDMMLTDHEITWEEHYAWFQRMEAEPIKRNFVFTYQGKSIGYIGYTEYDEDCRTCSPGAYLGGVSNLPPDAALCLFYVSVDYAFQYMDMLQLNTDVFADNRRAIKLDTFLGYDIDHTQDHQVKKKGEEKLAYRLIMTKDKWLKQKENVAKYFSFFKNFVYV